MGYDLQAQQNYTLGGKSFAAQQTISQPNLEATEQLIPIAQPGVLTVHTSTTAGSLTMTNAAHGINSADHIDLYWTNPDGTLGFVREALVGVVAGSVVPFSTALGDAIPAAATAMIAAKVQSYLIDIIGDNISALLAAIDFAAGQIVLLDTGGTVEDLAIKILPNGAYAWIGTGTNPIAGKTIDTVHMSHNDIQTPRNGRLSAQLKI